MAPLGAVVVPLPPVNGGEQDSLSDKAGAMLLGIGPVIPHARWFGPDSLVGPADRPAPLLADRCITDLLLQTVDTLEFCNRPRGGGVPG